MGFLRHIHSPPSPNYQNIARSVVCYNSCMNLADEGKPQPAGTQFLGLVDSLIDVFNEPGISDVEVVFIGYKLDDKGQNVVKDGQHVAEIRSIGLGGIDDRQTQDALRAEYEMAPLISLLFLWTRPSSNEKLGILKFQPITPGKPAPPKAKQEPWEKSAIADYIHRNNL